MWSRLRNAHAVGSTAWTSGSMHDGEAIGYRPRCLKILSRAAARRTIGTVFTYHVAYLSLKNFDLWNDVMITSMPVLPNVYALKESSKSNMTLRILETERPVRYDCLVARNNYDETRRSKLPFGNGESSPHATRYTFLRDVLYIWVFCVFPMKPSIRTVESTKYSMRQVFVRWPALCRQYIFDCGVITAACFQICLTLTSWVVFAQTPLTHCNERIYVLNDEHITPSDFQNSLLACSIFQILPRGEILLYNIEFHSWVLRYRKNNVLCFGSARVPSMFDCNAQ